MPIYEYDCPTCGTFEVSQRMTDEPLARHECGSAVSRRMSLSAFALKGGGWSSDGYASSQGAPKACNPEGCGRGNCAARAGEA